MIYYPSLDGLRALAVMIVLVAHAGFPFPQSGGVGVDIFFVLSGFLITSILADEARQGRIYFRNFYARRMLRLMPGLLLACLFVLVTTWVIHRQLDVVPEVAALTYTTNWIRAFTEIRLEPLEHCWSLAIEEQYYLIWPIVILAVETTFHDNRRNALCLLAVSAALGLYRFACVGLYSEKRIYFGLDTHADGLVLGGALAYAINFIRLERPLSQSACVMLSYLLTPVALGVLLYAMWQWPWWSPVTGRIGYSLVAIAAAVVVADLTVGRYSFLRILFRSWALIQIGRISYGIYLLHMPVFVTADAFLPEMGFAKRAALKIVASILVAAMSYYLVERHFLRLKRCFSNPSRKVPPQTEAMPGELESTPAAVASVSE
jgi:peptidoglycan/LPS O-acetylase OafA/YrhL